MLIRNIFKNKNTRASMFYFIGNIFNKGIAFFTIPIFTRLMSVSDYGLVNTYLSWISILSIIVGLSLGMSIRSAYIDFKDDLDNYISSIFTLSLINFLVSSFLIIIFSYIFVEEIDIVLVVLCLVQSFFTFILNSVSIKYMMEMNYVKNTLLIAVPNFVIALVSVFILYFAKTTGYYGRILPYVAFTSLFGGYFLIKYLFNTQKKINHKYWSYGITLSLPLIFHSLSTNILSVSDRSFISYYVGTAETGVYSLVYNVSMVAAVVTTAIESVWIPWFTNKLQNNNRDDINKNVNIYLGIATLTMIVILMISPEVLKIMTPPKYWWGIGLIPPVLVSSFLIFLYSISVNLEYYYKSTKVIALNTIVAAALNLLLNFIFIPEYGSIGAAYTTVASYFILFLLHFKSARNLDKGLFSFIIYVRPLLLITLSVVLAYIFIEDTKVRWGFAVIILSFECFNFYKKYKNV
ncbi:oligosaccharide flippase family protein [Priestia megaterium]|uniref:lipopolysaccharide biosynthesis protein n=1 Tax=Priestia megaterium TaxID=1404 RepID=UPI0020423A23|nr:oligosaccharide flippase family protein [Priestia megaterium]MCM3150856.1 oligosaccharide flippase family protein [Priestia megaterium]